LAGSKPIVSTNLNECNKYKSVIISTSANDFTRKLKEALKLGKDKKYLKLLESEAKENSWHDRVKKIDKALVDILRENQ